MRAEPKTDFERGFAQGYESGWSLAGRAICTARFCGLGTAPTAHCAAAQPCMLAVHLVDAAKPRAVQP